MSSNDASLAFIYQRIWSSCTWGESGLELSSWKAERRAVSMQQAVPARHAMSSGTSPTSNESKASDGILQC